jgi:hypothetical protein
MSGIRSVLIAAAVAVLVLPAYAKKMVVLSVDKGELFEEPNRCEQSITEEHAKKGNMMIKVVVEDRSKSESDSWWIGGSSKKIWDGFDLLKFKAFNPQQKPLKLWLHFKFGTSSCTWDKRYCPYVTLKPGENDVEVELMGAATNDGTPVDWKQKIASYAFTLGPKEAFTFYIGNMWLETEGDKDK